MTTCIQSHRRRTRRTQQQVADMFLTTKPNICNIEKGRRHVSADIMMAGYERCDDPVLLTEMTFEFSNGYTIPALSNDVYDDHRVCIKERFLHELSEAVEALEKVRLDKRPECCTKEDSEQVLRSIHEVYDVLLEGHAYIDKAIIDYKLNPQELAQSRNRIYKMQRRI